MGLTKDELESHHCNRLIITPRSSFIIRTKQVACMLLFLSLYIGLYTRITLVIWVIVREAHNYGAKGLLRGNFSGDRSTVGRFNSPAGLKMMLRQAKAYSLYIIIGLRQTGRKAYTST
jgi:hypothetical protein